MKKTCVHIYTGDGKGKTTAATGLAVRAAASGLSVAFCQFLKSGTSGELASLERLGVQVFSPKSGSKFVFQMNDEEKREYAKIQGALLSQVGQMYAEYDLVVMDETLGALSTGMINRDELISLIKNKPATTELVLTGRGADEELIALADYCTEMRCVKHPFESGGSARKGIEF